MAHTDGLMSVAVAKKGMLDSVDADLGPDESDEEEEGESHSYESTTPTSTTVLDSHSYVQLMDDPFIAGVRSDPLFGRLREMLIGESGLQSGADRRDDVVADSDYARRELDLAMLFKAVDRAVAVRVQATTSVRADPVYCPRTSHIIPYCPRPHGAE